jgi:hypothetical protein
LSFSPKSRGQNALQKQVRAAGGFQLGNTKEEVIAKLREQRQEIFEAEYAHLYRQ